MKWIEMIDMVVNNVIINNFIWIRILYRLAGILEKLTNAVKQTRKTKAIAKKEQRALL